ncbi:hypothetical protein, partial [Nocardiopsis alba]|uniref:hypothetical protein n=1 Tax=Nocardiopsis alba TaxID=53437 RepID=UPI0033EE3FE7
MRGRARGRGGAHQYSRLRGTATGFPGGRADTGPATSARMVEEVDDTKKSGDTLGGVVEVLAYNL